MIFKVGEARSILDLSAYPLRFASDELKASLLARGKRMWELRLPQLVTYKGMDFLQEKFIVGSAIEKTIDVVRVG